MNAFNNGGPAGGVHRDADNDENTDNEMMQYQQMNTKHNYDQRRQQNNNSLQMLQRQLYTEQNANFHSNSSH